MTLRLGFAGLRRGDAVRVSGDKRPAKFVEHSFPGTVVRFKGERHDTWVSVEVRKARP